MFYQRVQKANSQTPVRQQNNRLFPRPSDNFKPLPAPTTPDGRINLSRLPASDWMKNDPVLQRWAQEEAAANSSDTPSVARATDAAQPTAYHNETVNPDLENLQVNSQTGVSPLPDGEPTEKAPRFQPILSRLPTSDWMKNDPVLQRWAQEEAAAKSSKTPEIPQSIQAKLTVSTPGDKYEQEADAMAAKVMAMPDRAIEPQQIASKQSNSTTAAVQRAGTEDKTVSPELENRIQNATGGSPLPSEVRAFMEPRFGVDFSAIEVHTDSAAAQMCKEVGAKAFAVGNRIYYGAGYAPGKNELTAHELTHTIQQGAAKRLNKQVWQLPEPQEMLVAKKINISPHNNRQVYKFPLEEAAPEPQKVEPTFNRVSRQIAVEELPESILQTKQFTDKAEPNFNKIQPHSAEQISQTEPPQAKSYLSLKTAESRPLSVSQTSPQIQGNGLKNLAVQAAIKVLETALRPFGQVGAQVLAILRSAGNAFGTIATNPRGFLSNLCTAVVAGFRQFASRIGTHLQNGLVAWLTGALGSTLSMPSKLDARGVVSLVLQVLNINYGRFRGLLAKRLGDAKVKRLESGFALMQRIASNGFVAAIQQMMQSAQQLQQLQQTVVEGIRNWVIETVVKKAVAKLVTTFTGFGAIANVIQAIYNAIAFFIEQASQIQALVKAVKDSIGNIAAGQVGAATNYIESALARSLSVAINFLARQVGLGNVGQKVREIIQRVRARVDAAVNKLIEYVAGQGNSWLAKAGGGRANNQQRMPNNRPKPQPTTQNRPGQNNRQPAPNQRPKQQPARQNRPGQNNRQPAPNQRPKQQPATQNRPGQNNQKPTPKLTPAEIRQHEQMANEAVRQLENTNGRLKDYNTTRAEKIAQARTMKPNYDRRLKSPIKFNVHFESNIAKDKADNDLDFKVVIAPNNTTKSGSVPTNRTPEQELKLAKDRFKKEIFEADELKQFLMKELKIGDTNAKVKISRWKNDQQLFEIEHTNKRTFDGNSELVKVSALDAAKKHFDNQVFKKEQLLDFMRNTRRIADRTTENLMKGWQTQNPQILFSYESEKSKGRDRSKTFSFNQALLPKGHRPVTPNNRAGYGYVNPVGECPERLKILVKGLIIEEDPNSATGFKHNYKPGKENDWEYIKTDARFRCVAKSAPGQEFKLEDVIMGHIPEKGAVEHWNGEIRGLAPGHTQTYEQNKKWNQDPDNYHGPENKRYSGKTGGESMHRYVVPSPDLVPPSHPMWWDPTHPDYK